MNQPRLDVAKQTLLMEPASAMVLEHGGHVSPEDVAWMVDQAERYCRDRGEPTPVRKRLVMVLVEAADNVARHGHGNLAGEGYVLVVRLGDGYRVVTGNVVPHATATLLAHRVELLNSMDPEDVKEHYLKLLDCRGRTNNGGAGLGMLAMARRSVPPIKAKGDAMGPFTAFFTLELKVGLHQELPPAAA